VQVNVFLFETGVLDNVTVRSRRMLEGGMSRESSNHRDSHYPATAATLVEARQL